MAIKNLIGWLGHENSAISVYEPYPLHVTITGNGELLITALAKRPGYEPEQVDITEEFLRWIAGRRG